jgi:signal recognition particle subunit SEC65|tara:strand:+ start:390 stop:968 length:579 start_codon:yes stop_codon:yes gene_type:complete
MKIRKNNMKPINITFNDFEDFETITGLLHGRRISRGLRIQKSIYDNIKNSNKHLEVHHEYTIDLPKGGQKKTHDIDIVIVNENEVLAFDSKSKSFNATQDAQGVLEEYQKYIGILEDLFSGKKVEYGVLKEEWDNPNKKKDSRYTYMNTRGVKVYDTYNFMKNNYGVTKEELIDGVNNEIYEEVRVLSETIN